MSAVREINKKIQIFIVNSIFCLSVTLSAAFVHIEDLEVMTKKSDIIIQAMVISQEIQEEPSGRLITLTTLDVLDGVKGAPTGRYVTLYQVGGELNGKVMRLSGQQPYNTGDEVVLFGVRLDEMIVSYGPGLGRFNVDRLGKLVGSSESFGDVVAVRKDDAGEFIVEHPIGRRYPSLDDFKKEIRSYLGDKDIGKPYPLMPRFGLPWDRSLEELIQW